MATGVVTSGSVISYCTLSSPADNMWRKQALLLLALLVGRRIEADPRNIIDAVKPARHNCQGFGIVVH